MGRYTLTGQPATLAGGGFLSVSGQNLVYQGSNVKLRGVNQNNLNALCLQSGAATVGSCDVADIDATENDWITLGDLGANHVRFGISYGWWDQNATTFYAALDQQIAWAKQNNLWVILNLFETPSGCYEGYSYNCPIWTDEAEQSDLIAFWVDVATHYVNEPGVAAFGILNEPTPPGPGYSATWYTLAQEIITAVRAVNTRTIVAVPTTDGLTFTGTFTGGNILYEVHDYIPINATHPGAPGQSWPGNFTEWDAASHYFDGETIKGNSDPYDAMTDLGARLPIDWAAANNVPLYIGEWGPQRYLANYNLYITDHNEAYDFFGVSHAYFVWRNGANSWGLNPVDQQPPVPYDQAQMNAVAAGWDGARPSFATSLTAANVTLPQRSGAAEVGEVLTGHRGVWRGYPRPTYALNWQRDVAGNGTYSDISGATSLTYTVVEADINCHLRLRVTATNAGGSATSYSAATALVPNPSAWSPADLGADLLGAWDFTTDTGLTLDGSNRIQAAADLGVNDNDLVPPASGQAPTRTTVGGLTGANFPSGTALRHQSTSLGGNVLAVFANVRLNGSGVVPWGRIASFVASADASDSDSASSTAIVQRNDSSTTWGALRSGSGWLADGTISNDTDTRVGSVFDGTNHKLYVNNTEVDSVAHNVSFGATGTMVVGAGSVDGWSGSTGGVISRILFMNRAPTSGERADIDSWLQGA